MYIYGPETVGFCVLQTNIAAPKAQGARTDDSLTGTFDHVVSLVGVGSTEKCYDIP